MGKAKGNRRVEGGRGDDGRGGGSPRSGMRRGLGGGGLLPGPGTPAGRVATVRARAISVLIAASLPSTTARSSTFSSSRTLPGHSYSTNSRVVSGDNSSDRLR